MATLMTWLAATWLADWLYGLVPTEYLPPERGYVIAAVLAAWAWATAYAAADAHQRSWHPAPANWYDLTLA